MRTCSQLHVYIYEISLISLKQLQSFRQCVQPFLLQTIILLEGTIVVLFPLK